MTEKITLAGPQKTLSAMLYTHALDINRQPEPLLNNTWAYDTVNKID